MTPPRREARKLALQVLFETNQTNHDPVVALQEHRAAYADLANSQLEFADTLVRGVVGNKSQIDEIIVRVAPAWPIDQIAATDRVALEIGTYEVCLSDTTPVEVAINEAVELAKLFGGENSAGFVNGVLRTIAEQKPALLHT